MILPHQSNSRISPPSEDENPEELSQMLAGRPYHSWDSYIGRIRDAQAREVWEINQIIDMEPRMKAMRDFIYMGDQVWIAQGFFCEYGFNITIGEEVFIGANCTLLDVCPIKIGSRTMLGPNVQILTPAHPVSPEERNGLKGKEWAKPVTIGNDCWLGAGVTVCPGVTIGDGVTLGAASVVTKDVPSRSLVVGNPGRVIKEIKADGTLEPAC
ncbi:hypothetical protein CNBD6150 [Cryptococcus deneoformans B-3501A]|uniref:Maltose O-acetyltransferase, putative n=2 Tax=Cryptococcus deneoformans TaxID=40410 RepID=Q5KJA5_CRYD1|nr:maltose O-acetyltransferase, putative [Cryptococcus neoformans var. neoformans JEC21]XP_775661.1 hypothetical protein CNBD6150 [Cryptococcus neoformans var. neoformans B-3501A]AAR82911.1 putative O-acetyl transferase [Cryptococcus neoformans var. neoformans]AAW43048.1 maltose O-acetyltransferase, putative [Cryptococcus neoformans var. neoformans JEC21]EAL21014.1 hypothetical protein CNBD6150 [Cryptococcus neoformans var. neoformans B-3501A]